MLPADLATDITPSATVHCAGDLSLADTHSSRFFPSNRMMASEGGAPQVALGVTTFGSGDQTSVSAGLAPDEGAACDGDCADAEAGDWATTAVDIANTAKSAAENKRAVRFMLRTYTGYLRIEISENGGGGGSCHLLASQVSAKGGREPGARLATAVSLTRIRKTEYALSSSDEMDCRSVAAFQGQDYWRGLFGLLSDGNIRGGRRWPGPARCLCRHQPRRVCVLHRCDASLLFHVQAGEQGPLIARGAVQSREMRQ